jgi:ferredoxin
VRSVWTDHDARPAFNACASDRVKYELRVNPIACTGHGVCAELFPEWIELDEWGYPIIERGPIPHMLLGHARRAADACPKLALTLVAAPPRDSPRRR